MSSTTGTIAASYERCPLVACARERALLVVPVENGAGDLERAVALTGSGRALWEALGPRATLAEIGARLGGGPEAAAAFVGGLLAAGLLRGPPPVGGPAPAPSRDAAAVTLEVEDVCALAAAILAQGCALVLRARGHSMRPQLPDGARIEVAPRPFAAVRSGEIALYSTAAHRLVAHRVIGRRGECLLARGDSAARLDVVTAAEYLGVAIARLVQTGGELRRIALTTRARRFAGRARGLAHRLRAALTRWFVIRPLRRLPLLRRASGALLGVLSGGLRRIERVAGRVRRRLDIGRAGLMTTREKDAERRALYARSTVREFTALDENVAAGLTLIEELLVSRHLTTPARVLVLGCGPGRECLALARLGCAVTGLDREPGMLERARAFAARERLAIRFVAGEAAGFALPGERFERVAVFSGLYNMLLPSAARIELLRAARTHLDDGGEVWLTFLSDYVPPGSPPPLPTPGALQAINPEHEIGDRYLLNEVVHVFPHPDRIAAEARAAGLRVKDLYRDQRAYDRATRQVRGYAVLVRE
jgi:SAM-dependent methyltransferase